MSGSMINQTFVYDNEVTQTLTITTTAEYDISASGAAGGNTNGLSNDSGGEGALLEADFDLEAGDVLEVIVGGAGLTGTLSGGGGGGSEVYDETTGIVLIIAGGGGGAGLGSVGQNASLSANGTPGVGSGAGAGGSGIYTGSGEVEAAGGGGGLSDPDSVGGSGGDGGESGSQGGPGGGTGGFAAAPGQAAGGGAGAVYSSADYGGAGGSGAGGGGGGGEYGGGGGGGAGGGGGGAIDNTGGGGGGGGSYIDTGATTSEPSTYSTDSNGLVTIAEVVCYLEGTRIATPNDTKAIEALRIGDQVLTADGAAALVRWMGRRVITEYGKADCVGNTFLDPLVTLPIRICSGALGRNLPVRDLLVSPCHAVLVDGILVQAGALVNGATIFQETDLPKNFTYYHIELANHALVLAEGVPAETYVDNVTRMGFDNWDEHEALYHNSDPIMEMDMPRVQSLRQLPPKIRDRLHALTLNLLPRSAA